MCWGLCKCRWIDERLLLDHDFRLISRSLFLCLSHSRMLSWPMLIFVTYPLIFGVSLWAFHVAILPGNKPPIVVLGWFVITIGLIVALALTGCRDPGILYRHTRPPPQVRFPWFHGFVFCGLSISHTSSCIFLIHTPKTKQFTSCVYVCLFCSLDCDLLTSRMKIIGGGMIKRKHTGREMLTLIRIRPS